MEISQYQRADGVPWGMLCLWPDQMGSPVNWLGSFAKRFFRTKTVARELDGVSCETLFAPGPWWRFRKPLGCPEGASRELDGASCETLSSVPARGAAQAVRWVRCAPKEISRDKRADGVSWETLCLWPDQMGSPANWLGSLAKRLFAPKTVARELDGVSCETLFAPDPWWHFGNALGWPERVSRELDKASCETLFCPGTPKQCAGCCAPMEILQYQRADGVS